MSTSVTFQFPRKTGFAQQPPRRVGVSLMHKDTARQKTQRSLDRARELIGDENLDSCLRQQRFNGGNQDKIIGAEQFDHMGRDEWTGRAT